jgi:phosphonate transport system substrate-binding protein
MVHPRILAAALLLLSAACARKEPPAATAAPAIVRVTGIPDENPTELARSYQPMTDLLRERLGVAVEYVPVTDYGAAVQALAAGKVDFAWLGGFTHVQARNLTQVVPVAMRDIDREFKSVIVASSAAGVGKPEDLKGKAFAFGSKSSTSGHLMPRYFLKKELGLDPDKDFAGAPVYSGAHDATVKLVESGKVAAGAVNIQVWERMLAEGKVDPAKVAVIWTTPPYVDYVWTARAAVAPEIVDKFKQTFLALDAADARHQAVLERMGAKKYVAASAADFDATEQVAREVGLLEKK